MTCFPLRHMETNAPDDADGLLATYRDARRPG